MEEEKKIKCPICDSESPLDRLINHHAHLLGMFLITDTDMNTPEGKLYQEMLNAGRTLWKGMQETKTS